ncbi:hypothetical protein ACSBL2_17470 [Pedobacter sp. AW31-3R]|uniref:hypothetical protein n=1 Tax=Pedobacter sp. AW31-3R TaxID=3445781 RepID=UPI003F9F2D83
MSKAWYTFGEGDPKVVSNYYLSENLFFYCLCGQQICAIYATKAEEGQNPKAPLSANLLLYIDQALATGILQPERPIDAKKHVYLRY